MLMLCLHANLKYFHTLLPEGLASGVTHYCPPFCANKEDNGSLIHSWIIKSRPVVRMLGLGNVIIYDDRVEPKKKPNSYVSH